MPKIPPNLCRQLRTKKMYTQPDVGASDFDSYCWCLKTMAALGPDQAPATAEDCRTGRPCFESQKEE